MTGGEYITIALAVIASLPGLLALRSQFAKDKIADRESRIVEETARLEYSRQLMEDTKSLIAPLKEQIKDLQIVQDKQEKEIRILRSGVYKLTNQIRLLGQEPVWVPPDE